MTKTVLTTMMALAGVKARIEEMKKNPLIDQKVLKELEKVIDDLNIETDIEEKTLSLLNFIDPNAFVKDDEEEEEEEKEQAEEEEEEEVQEEEEQPAKKAAPVPQFQTGGKGQFGSGKKQFISIRP